MAALLVAGGGFVAGDKGLSATLLRHAGLAEQATPRGRVSIEGLLLRPPRVLVISRYHPGELSANAAWLDHPALRRLPAGIRRVETDGRRWTCLGAGVAPEIARLRAVLAR
jgi:iron complex transport system substrate-binding protein